MKKGLNKKALFAVHGWLGLNLGLLLFVICFSGAIAVLSHEIDWLLDPAMRTKAHTGEVQWSQLVDAVESEFPEGIVRGVSAPSGPKWAAVVHVQAPTQQLLKFHLHPETAEIQGQSSGFNVQRFFRSFHMALFFHKGISGKGIFLVPLFGFVLGFSVITGLLFYKGWYRNLFKLRVRKGARVLASDLHRLLGVWSLLFGLVISVTGVWYFAEMTVFKATSRPVYIAGPKMSEEQLQQIDTNREKLQPDELVRRAVAALPGLKPTSYRPAVAKDDFVYIDGQTEAKLVRPRANRVYLHPWDGTVVKVQRAGDLTPVRRWQNTADELHFGTLGTWGGLWSKLIWAFFGMMLPVLILAGAFISWKRAGGQCPPGVTHVMTGTTIAVLCLVFVNGYFEIQGYGPLVEISPGETSRQFPQVVRGVWVVLGSFILLLAAVVLPWLWIALRRSS